MKVQKILLYEDIILNVGSPEPGETGVVIVKQDLTGNHQVLLPTGYYGNIYIEPTPGKSTRLDWLCDDEGIYFTSTVITPVEIINAPAAITDLTVSRTDSISVKIQWTAPSGDGIKQNVSADKYIMYISTAPITSAVTVSALTVYNQNLTPAAPGTPETFSLTNLQPNTPYYLVIQAIKTTYGTKRTGGISNVLSIHTLTISSDATVSAWMPIDASKTYISGRYDWQASSIPDSQVDHSSQIIYNMNWCLDYDNVQNVNGVLQGNEPQQTSIYQYGIFFSGWYNTPYVRFIMPLDGTYSIDKACFLGTVGVNFDFTISTSSDGTIWNVATDSRNYTQDKTNTLAWATYPFTSSASTNVNYISLDVTIPAACLQGLAFFGKKSVNNALTGTKYKRVLSSPIQWTQAVGTNGFLIEDLTNMAQISNCTRFYNIFNWFFNSTGYGQGANINESNLDMRFSTSRMWDFDYQLNYVRSLGIEPIFTVNDELPMLAPADYASDPTFRKSLNSGITIDSTTKTLNPYNWSVFARVVYNIVARYGFNTSADTQYISLSTGDTTQPTTSPEYNAEPLKVGLGYCKYFETINEPDKYWKSQEAYYNPQELAMRLSVGYDGHKGALGAGYGMQAADPNAKQVMPGLSCTNIGYVKEMLAWWDVNRGKGDYPIHALNIHYYNSNHGSQGFNEYDTSITIFGTQPEYSDQPRIIKQWVDFRDSYCPQFELWITEVGYDEQNFGAYAPFITDLVTRHVTKAQYLMRSLTLIQAYGFDRIFQYMFRHQNANDVWAQDTNTAARDTFLTSGYMVPHDSGGGFWTNSIPTEAWWYMTAFRNEMTGYTFSHFIREYGNSLVDNNPIENYVPEIFALAYTHANGSNAILAWLAPTSQAALLSQQDYNPTSIVVNSNEVNVMVVDFDNAHISQTKSGHTTTYVATQGSDGLNRITVNINETPKIIKTNNVGTKKLIDPVNFQGQALDTTTAKIVWTDKNIGTNNTLIFMSQTNNANFTQIYNGYIDNGSYTVSGLSEGQSYYFKIQFELNGATSNETAVVGIGMPVTIPVPTNFQATQIKSTSISLGWSYSAYTMIDSFEIWKSNTADGTYNRIAVVDKSTLAYTDVGLVASTEYYYKIRAVNAYDSSAFSFAYGVTTDAATANPPNIIYTRTNYSGDRILIEFDLAISDPSGNQSAFTVIDNGGSLNYINVTQTIPHPTDNTKMYLCLANAVASSADTVSFSYNSTGGTIQSIYNVKLDSVSGQAVINDYNNSSLLSRVFKVNFTDSSADYQTGWNNLVVNSAVAQITNLVDISGNTTNVQLTIPADWPSYAVGYSTSNFGQSNPQSTDPINSIFPSTVRLFGLSNNGYGHSQAIIINNVDSTKAYNIKIYFDKLNTGTINLSQYKNTGTTQSLTIGGSANMNNYTYMTNIMPGNTPVTFDSNYSIDMTKLTPNVAFEYVATDNQNMQCDGIIIEEFDV